ncbi:MAG: hypothetical protein GY827_04965 [Cytophagales bacterium]|nr:hypothetical protein [Cytophagales bacterium]
MPRKEKKYHFIYKTTNLLTGRYYIGMHSTNDLEDGYLGSGKRLRYSIRKYGSENHQREILEFCNSRKELKLRESEIVTLNEIAKEDCINLKVGGEGGFSTHEEMLRISSLGGHATKKRYDTDEEFRLKMQTIKSSTLKRMHKEGKIRYDTFTGKKHSEETKRKIGKSNSENQKGSKNSQYGTCWITNGFENKKIKKEELELWESKGFSKGRN